MLRTVQFLASAAVVVAAGLPAVSGAQTVLNAYGNGASLPAPYWRQAADCYGVKTDLIFAGTPPTTQAMPDFNFAGTPPQDCATTDFNPNHRVTYKSTGSGTGIAAFYSHSPAVAGDIDPAEGTQLFPAIHYALSETSLGTSDVNAYNNGGTVQGVTVVAPGVTPPSGQYPNPRYNYGAMVQFPLLIAPVTIAYDPVYKKVRQGDGSVTEYSYNLNFPRADGTGGLRLSQLAVCQIFNGQIKNWNFARLTQLNGNVSLKDPSDSDTFSVPLQIVGRQDSSGTTSLWTRFLANACAAVPGNNYGDSTSRLPGTYKDAGGSTRTTTAANGDDLVGAVWDKTSDNFGAGRVFYTGNDAEVAGKYTVADGNDGVAKYLDFTQDPTSTPGDTVIQGRMGYVGPDYVLPGVLFTEQNTFNLHTSDVQNAAGAFRAPTPVAINAAFGSVLPPETNSSGVYTPVGACASNDLSARCRNQPQDWVEPASKTSPLANPTDVRAYAIVGTSNYLGYSCYAVNSSRTVLNGFITYYMKNRTISDNALGLLVSSGFMPLPPAWRVAIQRTFNDPTDPDGTQLTIHTRGQRSWCPNTGEFGRPIGG